MVWSLPDVRLIVIPSWISLRALAPVPVLDGRHSRALHFLGRIHENVSPTGDLENDFEGL